MRPTSTLRRLVTISMLASAFGYVGSANVPTASAATCTPGGLCAGGEYHPVTPTRIFDSRNNINDVAPLGAKPSTSAAGTSTFDIQLLGVGPIPADGTDVLAVVVNITVVSPTRPGWLAAYPSGQPQLTESSLVNFDTGDVIPNLAIVRPGASGKLTVRLFSSPSGSAHVLIDVFGWVSTSTYGTVTDIPGGYRGARLVTLDSPTRIMDTRGGSAPTPLGPVTDRELKVRGSTAVPDDGDIVGLVANVTAVFPTAGTYVTVQPDPVLEGTEPLTSNLNLRPGQIKANLVVVPIGADGNVHLYNQSGQTNLIVDVVGYLRVGDDEATRSGRIVPLSAPFRAFDTRQASFGAVPLGPGQAESWSFSNFSGSVTIDSTSVGPQSALFGNLTMAGMSRQYPGVGVAGYLTVYPGGTSLPNASNVNFFDGGAVPNMVLARYGSGQIVDIFNAGGFTHYLLDVSAVVLAD